MSVCLLNNAPGAQIGDKILDDILKVFVGFWSVAIDVLCINRFDIWAANIRLTRLVQVCYDFLGEGSFILASDILVTYV